MHRVTEIELPCERHETVRALLDDAAAGNHVEAGGGDFDGVAANIGKGTQIVFKRGELAIVRAGVKTGTNKIAHFVISRAKKVMRIRATAQRVMRHRKIRPASTDMVCLGRCDVIRKVRARRRGQRVDRGDASPSRPITQLGLFIYSFMTFRCAKSANRRGGSGATGLRRSRTGYPLSFGGATLSKFRCPN